MVKKNIYMLCGLPGCGKSTWAADMKFSFGGKAVVISSDAIRAELYGDESIQGGGAEVFRLAHERIAESIKDDSVEHIVFDAINLRRSGRKEFVTKFKDSGMVQFHLVYFDVDCEKAMRRNAARSRVVPENVIKRMAKNMDVPSMNEPFDHFVVVRDGSWIVY